MLLLLLQLFICFSPCWGQSLVLTFDDGPNLDPTPLLSGDERNRMLLDAFAARHVRVVLFANGIRGGDTPAGRRWLEAWGRAGHQLGNHTYHHLNLNETTLAAFRADLLELDGILRPLPGFRPVLRFPYLLEGPDPAARRSSRATLRELGYAYGWVTVSTMDWRYNQTLHELLLASPKASIDRLRSMYFKHLLTMLTGYRDLGRKLLGRDPVHVLLLHHNLLNALVMPDLLDLLADHGWRVVAPERAFTDPVLAGDLADAPESESVLGALARLRGVELATVKGLEEQPIPELRDLLAEGKP